MSYLTIDLCSTNINSGPGHRPITKRELMQTPRLLQVLAVLTVSAIFTYFHVRLPSAGWGWWVGVAVVGIAVIAFAEYVLHETAKWEAERKARVPLHRPSTKKRANR